MLVVETVARIRREFFVMGKSIKEIVRDLGVSRNTVRKVLRSGETAFAYERNVRPLPKLGPWAADLDRLLEANGSKARRERLTMIRIFEELEEFGWSTRRCQAPVLLASSTRLSPFAGERQRDRTDQPGDPALGARPADRVASHHAWQAAAERVRREL